MPVFKASPRSLGEPYPSSRCATPHHPEDHRPGISPPDRLHHLGSFTLDVSVSIPLSLSRKPYMDIHHVNISSVKPLPSSMQLGFIYHIMDNTIALPKLPPVMLKFLFRVVGRRGKHLLLCRSQGQTEAQFHQSSLWGVSLLGPLTEHR